MKTNYIIAFALILFTGCTKNNPANPTLPGCKIIHVTKDVGGSEDITYNSDGTIKTFTQFGRVYTLVYNGNTYTATGTLNGNFFSKSTVTFNVDSLITNSRTSPLQNGSNWQNIAYQYNGTQLSKETFTTDSTTAILVTDYQWSGGNLTSSISYGPLYNYSTTYTYYTNKPNQDGDYFSTLGFGSINTIRNKNLLKSIANDSSVGDITYTFDTDGKITSWIIDYGTYTHTNAYTYQCN